MHPRYEKAYRELSSPPTMRLKAATQSQEELLPACAYALHIGDDFTAFALALEVVERMQRAPSELDLDRMEGPPDAGALHTITVFDAEGRVERASVIGASGSGYRLESILNKRPEEFMAPTPFRARLTEDLEIARNGIIKRGEGWSQTPGGARYYSYILAPLPEGAGRTRIIALAADLTPLRAQA